MKLHCSALVLSLVSCGALAQSADIPTVDQVLTQEDELTQISEGFYAKTNGTTESYVAVGPVGQRTLLAKLLEIRASMSAKSGNAAAKAGFSASSAFDDLINSLSAPQPKNQEVYGTCNGPVPNGPLYAKALAGGGVGGSAYGASGIAVNNDGLSPPLNTTNNVSVVVYDADGNIRAQQSSTQFGGTTATASAYHAEGCTADSIARVTCPGRTSPSIVAVAHNQRTHPILCINN